MRRSPLFFGTLSVLLSILLSLSFVWLADRLIPPTRDGNAEGLLFQPGSKMGYRTREYEFVAHINQQGFRDREFSPVRSGKKRLVAIGDSLTFGWGVDISESWPKVLERRLIEQGMDVEVANLGHPGGSPRDYAQAVKTYLPLLKPDAVILGVLLGEDLAQSIPSSGAAEPVVQLSTFGRIKKTAHWLLPNLMNLLSSLRHEAGGETVRKQWREDARKIVLNLNGQSKKIYEEVDAEIKEAVQDGDLNPALLMLAITDPEYFNHTLRLNEAGPAAMLEEMSRQFKRAKETANEYQIPVFILCVPYRAYLNEKGVQAVRRFGFKVLPEAAWSNLPDEAIAKASKKADLPYFTVTSEFRKRAEREDLFFPLDGHMNKNGHALLAERAASLLTSSIGSIKIQNK